MIFAIICFIVFFLTAIFFICAGYVSYKRTKIIDELWMGCFWATIASMGCIVSGIRIYMGCEL